METRKTAGGIVVGPHNRVAVVSQNGDSWSLPKGGIDEGETPLKAAAREIREETGIKDLEYICDLGTYSRPRIGKDGRGEALTQMKELTFFLFKTSQVELSPEDPENPEAIWLEFEGVADKLTHQKDKDFFISVIPAIQKHLAKL